MSLRFRPRVEGLDERCLPDASGVLGDTVNATVMSTGIEIQPLPNPNLPTDPDELRAAIRWEEVRLNSLKAEREQLLTDKAAADARVNVLRQAMEDALSDYNRAKQNYLTDKANNLPISASYHGGKMDEAGQMYLRLKEQYNAALADAAAISIALLEVNARIAATEQYIQQLRNQLAAVSAAPGDVALPGGGTFTPVDVRVVV